MGNCLQSKYRLVSDDDDEIVFEIIRPKTGRCTWVKMPNGLYKPEFYLLKDTACAYCFAVTNLISLKDGDNMILACTRCMSSRHAELINFILMNA